mmetsp:Transcript_51674/g.129676  ORF Transcript_51674/g.129676 Transcript_51674/m.129676 type:complete len:161 (-) Transcript_51674:39-521(-)|eukprot:CAMPEP_0177645216 /NCGR_PEP_ID=MMETSP0447-20121125/9130_1 /TAXON_ID=0 /ORGANISM="Stygamoeba regulata, Strain BSH-02190019" /LENGTH=160 /DNA_ID=CAMNT_0019147683 /DNA_START=136 /DNA_END=618 /DNA_ORIENTATION=-
MASENSASSAAAVVSIGKDFFTGNRIYPGRVKRFCRMDCKAFIFGTGKSRALFLKKRNPRKISWTVAYRIAHKKGDLQLKSRRRNRRTVAAPRAIVGASLEAILAKRNESASARQAAQKAHLRVLKERRRAKKEASKKAGNAPNRPQQKAANKNVQNKGR